MEALFGVKGFGGQISDQVGPEGPTAGEGLQQRKGER
jgi:hypothetical protein